MIKSNLPKLDVFVWGFSAKELETFPQGSPRENGILSNTSFLFSWPEEKIVGAQKNWNRKPKVSIYVFQFDGKFDIGFSGAPVCYSHGNNIVGVFTAKDDSRGFVIPIETLLEKFEGEQKVAYASPTVDMSYYVEKGNKSLSKGDYFEAIEEYEIVLRNLDGLAS